MAIERESLPPTPPRSFRSPIVPSSRRELFATVAVVAGVSIMLSLYKARRAWVPHATPEQCAAMLDRYVEHRARASDPSVANSAIFEQKSAARALAGDNFDFQSCPRAVTRREADCALASEGADAFERCFLR